MELGQRWQVPRTDKTRRQGDGLECGRNQRIPSEPSHMKYQIVESQHHGNLLSSNHPIKEHLVKARKNDSRLGCVCNSTGAQNDY